MELDRAEHALLSLLIDAEHPWPWSIGELATALGDPLTTADALVELHAAGLVHRLGEFAWASRAATRAHQLAA
jgi:hypothetical protein